MPGAEQESNAEHVTSAHGSVTGRRGGTRVQRDDAVVCVCAELCAREDTGAGEHHNSNVAEVVRVKVFVNTCTTNEKVSVCMAVTMWDWECVRVYMCVYVGCYLSSRLHICARLYFSSNATKGSIKHYVRGRAVQAAHRETYPKCSCC